MDDDEPHVVLYAVGDSTGSGVGATHGSYVDRVYQLLRRERRHTSLVNLSRSGATASDVLREQVPRLHQREARIGNRQTVGIVLVGVGINDLVRRIPLATFEETYDHMLSQIESRVNAPLVVSNLPDVSLVPVVMREVRSEVAARVKSYNDVLAKVARAHGAAVFDISMLSRRMIPQHPEFISPDGFHPSDHGYEAWATEMWPLVRSLLITHSSRK